MPVSALEESSVNPSSPLLVQRVMLIGFGEFERHALSSYLRLSGTRVPAYEQVESMGDADFLIVDADHPGSIDQVTAAERGGDTVYIGSVAPEGALAWAMRPIDPLQVFRELDSAVALRHFKHAPPPLRTASGPMPLADEPRTAAAPAATAAAAPATSSAPQRRATDQAAAPLALLVDDSEIALRFLQRQLEGMGLQVDTAISSQQAIDKLSQRRYDAVFLDLDLGPDSSTDGLALCQHLKRQQRPHGTGLPPRVVMVSAHGSATDRVRGSFAGADGYLVKPIKEDTMLAQLRLLGLVSSGEDRPRRRRPRTPEAAAQPAATGASGFADSGPASGFGDSGLDSGYYESKPGELG